MRLQRVNLIPFMVFCAFLGSGSIAWAARTTGLARVVGEVIPFPVEIGTAADGLSPSVSKGDPFDLPSLAPGIKFKPELLARRSQGDVRGELRDLTSSLSDSMGVCACSVDETSKRALKKPLGQTSLVDSNGRRFAVSVMSFDLALKIFQSLEDLVRDPAEALRDGCFARAHEVSHLLEEQGVLTGKVMATGRFEIRSERLKNGRVVWGFHVAPIVVVKSGSERGIWVLDPTLFTEPVPIENWLALLVQNPKAQLREVFLTKRFVFHPSHRENDLGNWRSVDLKKMRRYLKPVVSTQASNQ